MHKQVSQSSTEVASADTLLSPVRQGGLSPKWDGYDTFTIEETAEIVRISIWKAYEMARKGDLPIVQFGRRMVVPRAMLEKLLGYR
jgi:excisionase family DNA binding protein